MENFYALRDAEVISITISNQLIPTSIIALSDKGKNKRRLLALEVLIGQTGLVNSRRFFFFVSSSKRKSNDTSQLLVRVPIPLQNAERNEDMKSNNILLLKQTINLCVRNLKIVKILSWKCI